MNKGTSLVFWWVSFDGTAGVNEPVISLYEWVRAKSTNFLTAALYGMENLLTQDTGWDGALW